MPQAPGQRGAALRTLLYVEDNHANSELVEQLIALRWRAPISQMIDINLPGIGGLQALKILPADPATKHIPVLAISANAMPLDIEKGLAAGFFLYLTKPFKVNEFMEALAMALEFAETVSTSVNKENCE